MMKVSLTSEPYDLLARSDIDAISYASDNSSKDDFRYTERTNLEDCSYTHDWGSLQELALEVSSL